VSRRERERGYREKRMSALALAFPAALAVAEVCMLLYKRNGGQGVREAFEGK